jgi:transcriptional regulator with XRE-family HTH domain
MDSVAFGRSVRALRHRRGWRQMDLAETAGVSQSVIARLERGGGQTIPPSKLDRVAQALGARLHVRLDWNGEALDRLLDGEHAALVERAAAELRALGWEVATEVTFAIRGERGSVDILAWSSVSRIVLVVEVKSVVPDIQATLIPLDRKVRLGREIARTRGWSPVSVSKLLVMGDTRTSRRRIGAFAATFSAELPDRNVAVRRWLKRPTANSPLRGLWFLPGSHALTTRHRVRMRRRAA